MSFYPRTKGLRRDFINLKFIWPYFVKDKRYLYLSFVLIPFISGVNALIPYLLKKGIDDGVSLGDINTLYLVGAAYFGLVLVDYLLRTGQAIMTAVSVNRMIMRLRGALADHILNLKASYHDRNLSGALTTRSTGDFENLGEFLNQGVLNAIVDVAILLGCLIGMFNLNIKLALIALVVLFFMTWIIHFFSQKLKEAMLKARVKVSALNAFTQECMQGSNTLKVLSAQSEAKEKFYNLNEEARKTQMGTVTLDALMFSVIEGISSITIGLILWSALQWGGVFKDLTAGTIIAFVQYIQYLFEPLKNLGSRMAMIQGVFTAIDRIFSVFHVADFVMGGEPPNISKGEVKFDEVSFRYDKFSDQDILKKVSFDVSSGKSLAVVGPTGSGKSTLIKVFSKLYDNYRGKILIDGQNLENIDPFLLRKQLAIVPQETTLFEGTLAFNIHLGDHDISMEDVQKAAGKVGLTHLINTLPQQWDFKIKEQGENLSHGQRQLVVFARALAKNPKIIVLDEATSSVDPESEKLIQKAISNMLGECTVIVIAHRLSTIEKCDEILLLKQGQVLEKGTHAELLAHNGNYYNMYHALH